MRGRPVIVNVWASWCLPCRNEGPEIRRFTADHPAIVVLGGDNDGRRADGIAFAREVDRGRTTGPVTYDSLSSVARRLGS